jgi:hypothetical protein
MGQAPRRFVVEQVACATLPRIAGLFLSVFLALLLAALLVAGCSVMQREPDRLDEIRASWREGYSVPAAELEAMPFYSITVRVDPANRVYTGSLDLDFPLSSTLPLAELWFRTYPNLLAFGGKLEITGARVNGKTVPYAPDYSRTSVQLAVTDPLQPGKRVEVSLDYRGRFERVSQPGEYTIFGISEDTTSLTNFYPILAARRGQEWALDVPHPQGDVGFHDAAVYRVGIAFPSDQVIVATGSEITRTVGADGWTTARYVIGPAREFTALLSPRFQVLELQSLGTRVRSYATPENLAAARSALYSAQAALQIYTDQFGPYPYNEMSVAQAPLTFRGMEFPSLSLIGSQVYSLYLKDLENLVVHEIAHQWWYNQVGSDQVRSPWLDEGLAEYSMYEYYAGREGEAIAQDLLALRWELPVNSLKRRNADQPIGRPVWDYKRDYEMVVYGKGALFFATLREEMGPLKFNQLLREWARDYQWKIGSPDEFEALASRIAEKDLSSLFDQWVYGENRIQQGG